MGIRADIPRRSLRKKHFMCGWQQWQSPRLTKRHAFMLIWHQYWYFLFLHYIISAISHVPFEQRPKKRPLPIIAGPPVALMRLDVEARDSRSRGYLQSELRQSNGNTEKWLTYASSKNHSFYLKILLRQDFTDKLTNIKSRKPSYLSFPSDWVSGSAFSLFKVSNSWGC